MRNFFLFIRRFFNLILFLTLEVICCVLIARTNTLQGNELLNSSNAVSGYFYKQQNALTYYFRLRQMNDSLINENQRLHMEIAGKYYTTDTLRDKLVTRIVQPADSLHVVQYASYIYREARVINNSVAKDNNHLTLNRGANDGIREGMAVISGNGVVGKVVHTSAHYADVLSILSEIQPVSSKLKDGTTGLSKWVFEKRQPRPDIVYMADVPREIKLQIGDSVTTTSFSFFPPDVLVGTVVKSEIIRKTGKRLLSLKPATNFRNVQYVYVVGNTMAAEQQALEAQSDLKKKGGAKK